MRHKPDVLRNIEKRLYSAHKITVYIDTTSVSKSKEKLQNFAKVEMWQDEQFVNSNSPENERVRCHCKFRLMVVLTWYIYHELRFSHFFTPDKL